MGEDEKFVNLKEGESTLPESTYNRTTKDAVLSRKKFHCEAGVWFCNVCNDIGRDDAEHVMKCQGCGEVEVV